MMRTVALLVGYVLWSSAMVALVIGAMIYLALIAFSRPDPDIDLVLLHVVTGLPIAVVALLFLRLTHRLFGPNAQAVGRTTLRFALIIAGTVWGLTWLVLDKDELSIIFLIGSSVVFTTLALDVASNYTSGRLPHD